MSATFRETGRRVIGTCFAGPDKAPLFRIKKPSVKPGFLFLWSLRLLLVLNDGVNLETFFH